MFPEWRIINFCNECGLPLGIFNPYGVCTPCMREVLRKQMAKENLEKKVDKTEIPEATFMMLLLKTAQMYERFADENYANLKDAKNLLSLGYTVTFYKQGGKLSYEAKPPEKIGFKP